MDARKRNTTITTKGVDPLVVSLRREQVRQGISNYALIKAMGYKHGMSLAPMWTGKVSPTVSTLRRVEAILQRANPSFRMEG